MRVLRLELRHFRGFQQLSITPAGHVVLVGEPGAGRSDVVDGLERVLWADVLRSRLPTDLDFFRRDTSRRAEVEVTLGELGPPLEQQFFDQLELWDRAAKAVVAELGDPQLIDREQYDLVVRLCYRVRWNAQEDAPEHWIDFPRSSDPDGDLVNRVSRTDREAVLFASRIGGRPLDLSNRGVFRRLVEHVEGGDFAAALETLSARIEEVAALFSHTAQMSRVLERVFSAARFPLRLDNEAPADLVRFLPEGGSLAGLVRSLAPAIDLRNGPGPLPIERQGSTVSSILVAAQALAAIGDAGIVAIDDFGEGLDAPSCQYLAAALRRSVAQCWLSTRRPHVVEAFGPEELVRLARAPAGDRQVFYGRRPRSRAERLAARHLSTQLLPALASRAVIVVEGPHDRAALTALARRLFQEEDVPPPSAFGITLVDAGAADASGGSSAVPRLTRLAGELGLRTVAVIDQDAPGPQSDAVRDEALRQADAVVRLPPRHAIERALLSEVPEGQIRNAVGEIAAVFGVDGPAELATLTGARLLSSIATFLKSRGGLHGQFVEVLPDGVYPPLLRRLLDQATAAARGQVSGLVQL